MNNTEWATCPNGHQYDPALSACPYCPARTQNTTPERRATPTGQATAVDLDAGRTQVVPPSPFEAPLGGGATVIDGKDTGVPSPPVSGDEERSTRMMFAAQRPTCQMPIFAWLVVLEGAQQYQDFRIAQQQVCIGGSTSECDIVLQDEFISGLHASIRYHEDGQFYITDQHSENGTFVNDMASEARIDHMRLNDGDEIRMGQVLIKFKCL